MTKQPPTTKDNTARIEGMAQWAKGVKADLAELKQAMLVTTHDRADGISLELATLKDAHKAHAEDYQAALTTKATLSVDSDLDDAIAGIEAQTFLNVSAELKQDGKLRYSNDPLRKAAVTGILADNEGYKALITEKRAEKNRTAQARALIAALDAEAKEYGRAVDILVARLNNLTARVA